MLLGTYTPKLDDKGRVILPAKFREELAGGVVVTRGQERCLYVFSTSEFARVHEQMRQAPLSNKRMRDFSRVFLAGASAETPDGQNRITLPGPLRSFAGLEKDLVVTGVGDRAEIWNAEAWDAYMNDQEQSYAELEEEVIPGIF